MRSAWRDQPSGIGERIRCSSLRPRDIDGAVLDIPQQPLEGGSFHGAPRRSRHRHNLGKRAPALARLAFDIGPASFALRAEALKSWSSPGSAINWDRAAKPRMDIHRA
jgi:hypothetical protein